MSSVRHSMKIVSERTGLSPHVLRVWERRYGAVVPERSDTNRRLYSEEEVGRLQLMARLTEAGHGIRQIATLPTADLREMVQALPPLRSSPSPATPEERSPAKMLLAEAWSHVLALDSSGLRAVLDRAAVTLGLSRLPEDLLVPLIERIGEAWETGELSVAEEHAASAVIKEVLYTASRPFAETTGAPRLVVTTPTGQLHELGAVLVSCAARRHGWNVTYLGPSLPAAEIARAAVRSQALAVGLSIVYPADDPLLPDELRQLRRALPKQTAILVGGRAAPAYRAATDEIGAVVATDLGTLARELRSIRERRES